MRSPTSRWFRYFLSLALMFMIFQHREISAQTAACDSLEQLGLFLEQNNADSLAFDFIDQFGQEMVIRIDKGDKEISKNILCIKIDKAGFYQFRPTILYTDNSVRPPSQQQNNESFFLQIGNSRGPCNPNLGKERVVVPDLEPKDSFLLERLAGTFFLVQGTYVLRFIHYFKIHALPGNDIFVKPPGFDPQRSPESVKMTKIVIKKLADCPVTINALDLALTKSVTPARVLPGEVFNYALQITNNGPVAAADINLTDLLPDAVSPIDFLVNPPSNPAARPLQWNFPALGVDDTIEVKYSASVPASFDINADSLRLINIAIIQAVDDTNASNDTASAVIVVKPLNYDLGLLKTVNPIMVRPGEIFTYSMQLHNNGPGRAAGIGLSDILPDSIDAFGFVEDLPIDSTARRLEWIISSLDSGETKEIQFSAVYPEAFQVPADSILRINTGVITARLDTNSQNDTASAVVTIKPFSPPVYDLEVISTVIPDSVFQGQEFTYFLQVINHGPDDASDIDLTDTLPDSVFINMFIRTPPINLLDRVLQWNFATLDSGQTVEIEFTATFPDSINLPPGFLRREKRSAISAQFDSNPANNTASAIVYVRRKEPAYDLQLTKSVTPTRVLQGQQFTYRIDVFNNGPNAAQGISILDAIPDGVNLSAFSLQPSNPFAADTLRWGIDSPLLPGAAIEISYTGICQTVSGGLDSLVKINSASVIAANDTMLNNNTDTTLVTCIQPPNRCDEFVLLDRSVFEPGIQDALKIIVDVGTMTDITLGVFDITGYPIKQIPTTHARIGKNTFLWNGQSNDGQDAGSGVYIIVARDRTSNGRNLECVQKVLVVR